MGRGGPGVRSSWGPCAGATGDQAFTFLGSADFTNVAGQLRYDAGMLSGDVNFAVDNLASYVSQIESGAMRALAITSAQRWPTLPDVPTMAEAGVKDLVVTSWGAYAMAAGTPPAIVDKLAAVHKEIAADEAMQKRFLAAGGRILHSTPAEAKAFAAKETKMWQEVVQLSGLKPQ